MYDMLQIPAGLWYIQYVYSHQCNLYVVRNYSFDLYTLFFKNT